MQKLTPFLWFDTQAEEAANFYVSLFRNSKITRISRYGDEGAGPKGKVMVVAFELEGQEFLALNGGPSQKLSEAFSLMVNCSSQEEVDYYWAKLSEGGKPNVCGWLTDRFGLSWQVTPTILMQYIGDPNPRKAAKVMEAMMQMTKIEIPKLEEAYNSVK